VLAIALNTRVLRTPGIGPCAARNVALDAATGSLAADLDDDNRRDPDWLKAVALTFAARPEATTAFGARIVDDDGRLMGAAPDGRPWMHLTPWDHAAVRQSNQGRDLLLQLTADGRRQEIEREYRHVRRRLEERDRIDA
jgi:glycosyltransferase involved in cell wall biosynthesis